MKKLYKSRLTIE